MSQPLRILLVDTTQDDAAELSSMLAQADYDILRKRVDTLETLESTLKENEWDLVISAHAPPRLNSLEALKLVRGFNPDLPFIVVSGSIGEEVAVDLIKAGADDYIVKDRLQRLLPALERCLRAAHSRRQHHLAQQALQESEARFRSIASNLPGMVFQFLLLSNGVGRFGFVSEGCTPLFGVTPVELQADPDLFLSRILPEDRPSYNAALAASAKTFATWNWEGRITVGDQDEIKWINIRATPRPVANKGVQWEGIMSNITQNKLAELEIKRSREQLLELSSHIERVKEQERARISREIHDDIGGTLTAIKIELMWLINRLPKDRLEMLGKASSIQTLVDRVIETTGRIARDLRPGILDFGLVPAIEWQAREFQNRMGIVCDVEYDNEDIELDPDLATALFRIFQETLTNISKHANATEVHASLCTQDGEVILTVADNGRGIAEADMAKPKSYGIRGIRERCRYLGGNVSIKGAPGKGTVVQVAIPMGVKDGRGEPEQQALF